MVSGRGVVRTHVLEDRPIFARPLGPAQIEARLRRFYDPYHTALDMLVEEAEARFGTVVVLDTHTASPRRMGDHEVVIGSRAAPPRPRASLPKWRDGFGPAAFAPNETFPATPAASSRGGSGAARVKRSHAVQIEINAGALMSTTIAEHRERLRLGRPPLPDPEAVERARRCLGDVVQGLAKVVSSLDADPSNRANA